jgi:hypothetical protein
MRNRRRNWLMKRMALGFVVAAFVAPAAQARVNEGSTTQAKIENSIVQAHTYQPVQANVNAPRHGMPHPLPHDPALGTPSPQDPALFVGTQPRSSGKPQVVAAGFDWKDAGLGAGFALLLVLLGGGAVLATRHVDRGQTA